jgi:hypothetical protein
MLINARCRLSLPGRSLAPVVSKTNGILLANSLPPLSGTAAPLEFAGQARHGGGFSHRPGAAPNNPHRIRQQYPTVFEPECVFAEQAELPKRSHA